MAPGDWIGSAASTNSARNRGTDQRTSALTLPPENPLTNQGNKPLKSAIRHQPEASDEAIGNSSGLGGGRLGGKISHRRRC